MIMKITMGQLFEIG